MKEIHDSDKDERHLWRPSNRLDKLGCCLTCTRVKEHTIHFDSEIYIPKKECEELRKKYETQIMVPKEANIHLDQYLPAIGETYICGCKGVPEGVEMCDSHKSLNKSTVSYTSGCARKPCNHKPNIQIPLTQPEPTTNLQEMIQMDGQELKTGEKKDEGKPRWELLAYDAIEGIVKVLTLGAKKYAARNWELGILYGRVFGAVQRHLSSWIRGETYDSETGLSHLDHALTELMFLSAYEKRGMKQFDDRPVK